MLDYKAMLGAGYRQDGARRAENRIRHAPPPGGGVTENECIMVTVGTRETTE